MAAYDPGKSAFHPENVAALRERFQEHPDEPLINAAHRAGSEFGAARNSFARFSEEHFHAVFWGADPPASVKGDVLRSRARARAAAARQAK